MPFSRRKLAFLSVCVLALACSACSSSNKGKIEGAWVNSDSIEGAPAGAITVEFNSDGTFAMKGLGMTLITAKYSLGMGDTVSFTDVKDGKGQAQDKLKGKVKIKIDGDNMTWTEDKATYKLKRVTKDAKTDKQDKNDTK